MGCTLHYFCQIQIFRDTGPPDWGLGRWASTSSPAPQKNTHTLKNLDKRNLNEGQWEDRKQWSLGVGQRRKTFRTRYIHKYIHTRVPWNGMQLTLHAGDSFLENDCAYLIRTFYLKKWSLTVDTRKRIARTTGDGIQFHMIQLRHRPHEKYEGWNFNSGNYLFTTHTK